MSVVIVPVKEFEQYKVNGHLVFKNKLKNWTCDHDLSQQELEAFSIYERLLIIKPLNINLNYELEIVNQQFILKVTDL
jgi:hypothetical protein